MAYCTVKCTSLLSLLISKKRDSTLVEPRSLGGCNWGTQTLDSMGCSDFSCKEFMGWGVGEHFSQVQNLRLEIFLGGNAIKLITCNNKFIFQSDLHLFYNWDVIFRVYSIWNSADTEFPEIRDFFNMLYRCISPKNWWWEITLLHSSFKFPTTISKHVSRGFFLTNKWSSSPKF